jgi:probable phosphoglycerate mutase
MAAVEDIAVKNPDRVVVLVSHNVVCRVLLCSLLGLDNSHFWQVGQDVCAINAFEIREGVPTVTLINDTCHL